MAMAPFGESDSEATIGRLATGLAGTQFIAAAADVIEEFRAEVVAARLPNPSGQSEDSVIPSLEHLADALADLHDRYQQGLPGASLGETMHGVFEAVHIMWKVMAYLAASRSHAGQLGGDPSDGITGHPAWTRYVGPLWGEFVDVLAEIPAADGRITPVVRDAHTSGMARVLRSWKQHVGFDLRETPAGPYFEIRQHSFSLPEPAP